MSYVGSVTVGANLAWHTSAHACRICRDIKVGGAVLCCAVFLSRVCNQSVAREVVDNGK